MKSKLEDFWLEISPYLDQVLDLDAEAQCVWLDDMEKRSPAIAANIRAYLLEVAELNEQDFMGVAAASLMGVAAASLLAQTSLAGRRFGAYVLDHAIGHGGMGTVWLAHRGDGRFEGQAAVKLLNTALVGHPSERRFVREGSVLAKLQHPHIAHLLDAGVEQGSQPYLVLEYVHGEPIDQYSKEHGLGMRQRIELFLDVLGAVAHAHSCLVVHRDLKPSNILVTEQGVVKLLDFGVAALLSQSAQGSTDLTGQLAPGLTPGYAAPEQVLGEPVTTATDVYSLGVLLFVLLAGRHPATPGGKTPAELARMAIDTQAPRPSSVAIEIRDQRLLRGDLDNIITMALRRNPAERYGTVEQFAQDLRRYLALEPVSARPRSVAYLTAMFVRRHRVAVAAAATLVVVLVTAVAITSHQMIEARYQRDQARHQSVRADASIDFLAHLMRSDSGPAGPVRTFHERLELGAQMLKKQYQDNPKFAGRMLVDLADYYSYDQETIRANQLYAQAYAIGQQHRDAELIVLAQCSRAIGDAYAGVPGDSMRRVEEARRLLSQMRKPDVTLQMGCLAAQAALEHRLGHDASAEALLRSAMSIVEEAYDTTESMAYAGLLGELSIIYLDRNQPREALRLAQLVVGIQNRSGRGGLFAGINMRHSVAVMLTAMGEIRQALAEREIISQRLAELTSPDTQPVAFPISNAALLLRMAGPTAELQPLRGLVERAREGGNPGWLAQALLVAGSTLTRTGAWDEADAALNEAAALAAHEITDANQRARIESFTAELAAARGDLGSAHRHLDRSLEFAGYRTQKPQRALARALLVGVRVAMAEGASADAERFARDSLAIAEEVARGPDTSADVGEALLLLAQARMPTGSPVELRPLLERAVRCLTNGLDAEHPLTVEARNLLASPQ